MATSSNPTPAMQFAVENWIQHPQANFPPMELPGELAASYQPQPRQLSVALSRLLANGFRGLEQLGGGERQLPGSGFEYRIGFPWDWRPTAAPGQQLRSDTPQPGSLANSTTLDLFSVLLACTGHASYLEDEHSRSGVLPTWATTQIAADAMPSDQVEHFIEDLFQPFTLQMNPAGDFHQFKQLPFREQAKLACFRPCRAFEFLNTRCGWKCEIFPLIVNTTVQMLSAPVFVDLLFDPADNAARWTPAERAQFWMTFHAAMQAAIDETSNLPLALPPWCNVFEGLSESDVDEIVDLAKLPLVLGQELDS